MATPGADLLELTYAGDECNSEENIQWMNELDPGNDYVQVAEFLANFTTREDAEGVLEPNAEYTDCQWRPAVVVLGLLKQCVFPAIHCRGH